MITNNSGCKVRLYLCGAEGLAEYKAKCKDWIEWDAKYHPHNQPGYTKD